MAMVGVDDSSPRADSPSKCFTFIRWTEWTVAMTLSRRQHHKHYIS